MRINVITAVCLTALFSLSIFVIIQKQPATVSLYEENKPLEYVEVDSGGQAPRINFEKSAQYRFCTNSSVSSCQLGLALDESLSHRHGLDDVEKHLVEVQKLNLESFKSSVQFVTGASSNHFDESIASLASLKKCLVPFKVNYYNLGLTASQLAQLRKICGLTIKNFNFSKYPPHVRNLTNFAWKALIVLETLQTHAGIMWFDSSIHFPYGQFLETSFPYVKSYGGILHYQNGHVTPYIHTHYRMFDYFPTNLPKFKGLIRSGEGGLIMYLRTHKSYYHVLKWYWLCALTQDCITPPKSALNMENDKNKVTHRFDQSILGILNANLFNFNVSTYIIPRKYRLKVARGQSGKVSDTKWCS